MTRRLTHRQKRPRLLNARILALVFARGGMLLRRRGLWHVYRSLDARRQRIGIVSDELADDLLADGRACLLEGPPLRLVAGPASQDQTLAATWASDWIRASIEASPFERCAVKAPVTPISLSRALTSNFRMSSGRSPE